MPLLSIDPTSTTLGQESLDEIILLKVDECKYPTRPRKDCARIEEHAQDSFVSRSGMAMAVQRRRS